MTILTKNRLPVYRSRKRGGVVDRTKLNVKRSRYMKKTTKKYFLKSSFWRNVPKVSVLKN